MTTLISSEWYKIIHSKVLAWILVGVAAQTALEVQSVYALEEAPFLGQSAVVEVAENSTFLAIWILAFVGFFVASEFQNSTVRNVLAIGKDRTQVYLSKLLAACIAVTAIHATVSILSTVGYTMVFGFGDMPMGEYLPLASRHFFTQLLYHLTFASIFCMFAFLGKSSGMTILLGIGWLIAEMILMGFFRGYPGGVLAFAVEYFPAHYISGFKRLNLDPEFFRQGIIVSLAYLVVPSLIGCAVFRRSEVK